MLSLTPLFASSGNVAVKSRVEGKKLKVSSSRKRGQARKNKKSQAVELVWLKNCLSRKVIVALILLSLVIMVPLLLPRSDIMPIETIRISGQLKQLDTRNIQKQLEHYLGQGFFSVDIKSIQQKISQQAWIESVSIQRVWPDKLAVHITEKVPVARWNEQHLLSNRGVIFSAQSNRFMQLPLINGYAGKPLDLLQRFNVMKQKFMAQGVEVSEMKEDSKGALTLLLNSNLIVKIGSDKSDIKIKHLLAVYDQQIKPREDRIKQIDFRYSNGFAIAWKDQNPSDKQPKRGSSHV